MMHKVSEVIVSTKSAFFNPYDYLFIISNRLNITHKHTPHEMPLTKHAQDKHFDIAK